MRYVGIDPGASGGIAWIDADHDVQLRAMPDTEDQIYDLLADAMLCDGGCRLVIERVQPMPADGVRHVGASSAFKFGRGYGFLRGILASSLRSWQDVPPQRWQSGLGLAKGLGGAERKRALRSIATQRFPRAKPTLKTCDALLLAEWLRNQYQHYTEQPRTQTEPTRQPEPEPATP